MLVQKSVSFSSSDVDQLLKMNPHLLPDDVVSAMSEQNGNCAFEIKFTYAGNKDVDQVVCKARARSSQPSMRYYLTVLILPFVFAMTVIGLLGLHSYHEVAVINAHTEGYVEGSEQAQASAESLTELSERICEVRIAASRDSLSCEYCPPTSTATNTY